MRSLRHINAEIEFLRKQMEPTKHRLQALEKEKYTATQAALTSVDWKPAASAPYGVEVLTKIDDAKGSRNETTLTRKGNMWWLPDDSMYVYYTPTHWAPIA